MGNRVYRETDGRQTSRRNIGCCDNDSKSAENKKFFHQHEFSDKKKNVRV